MKEYVTGSLIMFQCRQKGGIQTSGNMASRFNGAQKANTNDTCHHFSDKRKIVATKIKRQPKLTVN